MGKITTSFFLVSGIQNNLSESILMSIRISLVEISVTPLKSMELCQFVPAEHVDPNV